MGRQPSLLLDDRRGVRQAFAIAVLGHHHQCVDIFESQPGVLRQQVLHGGRAQIGGFLGLGLQRQRGGTDLARDERFIAVEGRRLSDVVDPACRDITGDTFNSNHHEFPQLNRLHQPIVRQLANCIQPGRDPYLAGIACQCDAARHTCGTCT
ncbi:hypothetical protein D3C78_1158670 [compost metagenome]